jgi:hypothetical protein
MPFSFTPADIEKISHILGSELQQSGDVHFWQLTNKSTHQSLALTLQNHVRLGGRGKGVLITIQTHQGYYELHDCNGFVIIEPDEVLFLSASKRSISSLVVGKNCTCSVYANIRREILKADFESLDPSVLLSAMQLSLAENVLN